MDLSIIKIYLWTNRCQINFVGIYRYSLLSSETFRLYLDWQTYWGRRESPYDIEIEISLLTKSGPQEGIYK